MICIAILETIFGQMLSIIVAVLIAAWMNKKSAEDTEKKIKSLKRLAKIQIETSQIQLNKELYETKLLLLKLLLFQTQRKEGDLQYDRHDTSMFTFANNTSQIDKDNKKRELSYEKDYYQYYSEGLEQFQKRLSNLSKELEDE